MLLNINKILIIQTASIGDVILATPLVEELHVLYPDAQIDFMLKKGIEGVFEQHPFLHNLLIWDKSGAKYKNLWALIKVIRASNYDLVVNCQRFASSGFVTVCSSAKYTTGFSKNPWSFLFTKRVKHTIKIGNQHETDRNLGLIKFVSPHAKAVIKLYPTQLNYARMSQFKTKKYICVAPASLWFTKQYPDYKWIEFIKALPDDLAVYFLGSKNDEYLCKRIIEQSKPEQCLNLAGKLSFLDTAALMRDAQMNYVNDSAPMHIASSMDAPVCAVFCSTVPAFGFGPLSGQSSVIETSRKLNCRPCGLHGFKSCPKKHFECATTIQTQQLLTCLSKVYGK
jgi:ADP-heptose:LPS heptosyltransferase